MQKFQLLWQVGNMGPSDTNLDDTIEFIYPGQVQELHKSSYGQFYVEMPQCLLPCS